MKNIFNRKLKDYKNLNTLLKYYVDNSDKIGIDPEIAGKAAGLKIKKTDLFLMCNLMFDDGYLYLPSETLTRYSAKYKAKLFLDSGGYVTEKRLANRKKAVTWMVETFDFLKYPIGLVLAIFALIEILKEYNLI